ncbi:MULTISPECIES: 5-formyltetrahydrofolate cyclo-ligase [Maribacter]|uniref:5-formyltetrahydrofolate cyclo-ligase n=1 Tax=Maribacter flavus TaxID=1658664 RepID=A0ABU7IF45_9FLAO|nr:MULTISPECIES: 5-formyltetrahydrofolate cyclo-ligase [Maribacter]MDC6404426.1 5-formyltetrahydrofolate cyclo-ligase [Maribacter sp. PR66]MEE1971570.1 5-formyltetrahydrofolate cyclo-ligase [Maribacter flavus]
MLKKDLRLKYSAFRKQLSLEQIAAKSLDISNKALELPIWSKKYYHIFLPITSKQEIDTINLLSILQGKDKYVIVPKVQQDTLEHYLLTDSTKFKNNSWGVPEPVDGIQIDPNMIDVVFIPLLAFDTIGHRVGYGKGYYDTFLASCRPDVLKVGLSFFDAEELITDVFPGDIPLDYCVTPQKNYSFDGS